MTTWNPSDSLNTSFSGANLIGTCNSTSIGNGVRTTTSKSSGKIVVQVTEDLSAGFTLVAMTTGGAYDDSGATAVQIYWNGSAWEVRANPGGFLIGGGDPVTAGPNGTMDTVLFYLDWTNNLLYFKVNGNYLFGGDASAGTGGISFTLPSSWFFTAGYAFAGQVVTLNPSPGSLPAGWSAWDAAAAGVVGKVYQTKQAIKRAAYW